MAYPSRKTMAVLGLGLLTLGTTLAVIRHIGKSSSWADRPSNEAPNQGWQTPEEWEMYRNEVFGFELRYPPHLGVSIDDPYGKNKPSFIHRNLYEEGIVFGPPLAFALDFDPVFTDLERSWYEHQAHKFKREHLLPGTATFGLTLTDPQGRILTNSEGKKLYGLCTASSESDIDDALRLCNGILTTLKITR